MAAYAIRVATLRDVPALEQLIAHSARELSRQDYSEQQVEAALGNAFGVDTELIRDSTYFVVEDEGEIVACGGWDAYRERCSALTVGRAANRRCWIPGSTRRGFAPFLCILTGPGGDRPGVAESV